MYCGLLSWLLETGCDGIYNEGIATKSSVKGGGGLVLFIIDLALVESVLSCVYFEASISENQNCNEQKRLNPGMLGCNTPNPQSISENQNCKLLVNV